MLPLCMEPRTRTLLRGVRGKWQDWGSPESGRSRSPLAPQKIYRREQDAAVYHYVKCEVHCKPQPVTSGVVLLGVLLSFRSVHKSGRPTAAASSTGDSMRKYFIHALGAN